MIAHEQILEILNKYLQGFTHQRILLSSKKMKHDTIPLLLIAEPSIGSTHKGVCHSSLKFQVFCCYVAFQLLIPTIHSQKSAQNRVPFTVEKCEKKWKKLVMQKTITKIQSFNSVRGCSLKNIPHKSKSTLVVVHRQGATNGEGILIKKMGKWCWCNFTYYFSEYYFKLIVQIKSI